MHRLNIKRQPRVCNRSDCGWNQAKSRCGFVICPCDLHGHCRCTPLRKQSSTAVVSRSGTVGNPCPRSRCRNPHDQTWSSGRVGFPRYCCAVDTITVNNVEQRESWDTCPKGQLMAGFPSHPSSLGLVLYYIKWRTRLEIRKAYKKYTLNCISQIVIYRQKYCLTYSKNNNESYFMGNVTAELHTELQFWGTTRYYIFWLR